jgi:DNA-binding transcriptional LysR family regulator
MQNRSALDVTAVRAFVLIADFRSFTRAAQASGTTQSAISLQLKRLETRLRSRLIERTPRSVELSADGAAFLDRARDFLTAHDRAIAGAEPPPRRLVFGITDHAAGSELTTILARVGAFDPGLNLDVRIGLSGELLEAFENAKLDAVIVRRERHRRGGETLLEDEFGWLAAPSFRRRPGDKLRLAMLPAPCAVRAHAIRTLDKGKIDWIEAFTGGGVSAITAAVAAGLAVAPLAHRIAPPGFVDVGRNLSLPPLGKSALVLHSRVSDGRLLGALRILTAAFRGVAQNS